MPEGTFKKFKTYIKETHARSPLVNKFVKEHGRQWYPDDFIDDLTGGSGNV
jgi:hypothetical protein